MTVAFVTRPPASGKAMTAHVEVRYDDATGKGITLCGWRGFMAGRYLADTFERGLAELPDDLGLCSVCVRAMEKANPEGTELR